MSIPLPGETISQMPAAALPLTGQELVPIVQNGSNVSTPVNNFISSSGGYTHEKIVVAGTSVIITNVSTFVGWASAATGAKTTTIPASTGSKAIITVSDLQGNADAGTGYPITVVPASGSISGNNQVYTNFGSITLYDSSVGWASI